MSRILEKAFDASKKIIRSVFKGSPNLLTTSDLNRQFEAIKHQLDSLEDRVGIVSDLRAVTSVRDHSLMVQCVYSYLRFKGCEFNPPTHYMTINFTQMASPVYLCLVADMETVTYEDDATHEIAGAKFEDGSSRPAANQIVFKNEELILAHSLSTVENLVGVIAEFSLSETGNFILKYNTIEEGSSIPLRESKVVLDFNPTIFGKVAGRTYDEAFSILENRFSNTVPQWQYLVTTENGTETPTDVGFRILNGVLYLNIPQKELQSSTMLGETVLSLGKFPSSVKTDILNLLKRIGFETYSKLTEGNWIPYGEFGCFPVYKPYLAEAEQDVVKPAKFGLAKVALILYYDMTTFELIDANIGTYVTCTLTFDEELRCAAPVIPWTKSSLTSAQIYVPRMIGSIPLFGPI